MALAFFGLLVGAVVVLLVAVGVGLFLGSRHARGGWSADAAPVARAERLRHLPAFRQAVQRRRAGLISVISLGAVALLVAGVVAARPMASQTVQPVNSSRDIMLCLDVSGSMAEVDVEVLSVFEELLDGFRGERIGLTIFNSSPVQVFPLTDDYEFVRTQLATIRTSFDWVDEVPEHWRGTLNGPGASLIGDGLASCTLGFDHAGDDRSRSVILSTDNEVNGASLVSLDEAAAYAASASVRVFSINPVDAKDSAPSAELAAAVQRTGGEAFGLHDTTTVSDIVQRVQEQEATELRGQARVVWADAPDMWIAILLILTLAFVVVLWRVRL